MLQLPHQRSIAAYVKSVRVKKQDDRSAVASKVQQIDCGSVCCGYLHHCSSDLSDN